MALVKFYRGLAAKRTAEHNDGLYFATDSHELWMNGVHYGLSVEDEAKLDGIAANAQVNVIESVLVKHNGGEASAITPSDTKGVTIDLSAIEANVATLRADLDALSGDSTGSVSELIATLKSALEAEDTAIKGRLDIIEGEGEGSIKKAVKDEADRAKLAEEANAAAIAKLNDGASVEGSVAYAVAQEATARTSAVKGVQDQIDVIKGDENTAGSINAGIKAAKTYADGLIDALDVTDAASGVVTVVNQENGKVAVTHAPLTSAGKSIVVDGLDLAVNIDGSTLVQDAETGKIGVAQANLSKYVGKEAIVVTGADGEEKTISLKVKEGDALLSNGADGLFSTIDLTWNTTDGLKLVGKNGAIATIPAQDFIKDGMLQDVKFNEAGDTLVFTFNTDAGEKTIELNVSRLTDVYEGSSTIKVDGKTISAIVDPSSEFFAAGDAGLKVSGINAAIEAAVAAEADIARAAEEANATAISTEADRAAAAENKIEESVGLNTDGSYKDTEKANALHKGATTVMGAIDKLDEVIRANNAAIATLNGEATVEGSVKKAAADTLAAANKYTDDALTWIELN